MAAHGTARLPGGRYGSHARHQRGRRSSTRCICTASISKSIVAATSARTPSFARDSSPHMVVTERLGPGRTFSLTWKPTRPGNWLFHCHDNIHLQHGGALDGRPAPPSHASHRESRAGNDGRAGDGYHCHGDERRACPLYRLTSGGVCGSSRASIQVERISSPRSATRWKALTRQPQRRHRPCRGPRLC